MLEKGLGGPQLPPPVLSADAGGAKTHPFRNHYFFFPFFKYPGPLVSSLLPFPGSGAAPALPRWRSLQGRNCLGCPSGQHPLSTPTQKMPAPVAPSQGSFQQVQGTMMPLSAWLGANLRPKMMPPSFPASSPSCRDALALI